MVISQERELILSDLKEKVIRLTLINQFLSGLILC